jgi:hypothetical protein
MAVAQPIWAATGATVLVTAQLVSTAGDTAVSAADAAVTAAVRVPVAASAVEADAWVGADSAAVDA